MKQQHKEPIASWPRSATSQLKIQQLAEILCTNSEVRDNNLFTKRFGQLEEGTPDNQTKGLVFSNGTGQPTITWETEIKIKTQQPYEQERTLYCIRCTYRNMNWFISGRYIPLQLMRYQNYGDLHF